MKKLTSPLFFLFFTASILYSCSSNPIVSLSSKKGIIQYNSEWTTVDSLEQLGLNKKALERCNSILSSAIENKNTSQIFKALTYRSKYINQLEENAEITILKDFEKYILESNSPTKQLLHSAIAEVYNQYYLRNQWKFNQRTYVEDGNDIEAFDKNRIEELIEFHYLSSMEMDAAFRKKDISELEEVFTMELANYEKRLRPSLYDFLCYRALDYFLSNGSTILSYIDLKVKASDLKNQKQSKLSHEEIAYSIYNNLIEFHSKDKSKWAYVHSKINQISFLKSNSIDFNYRDTLYSFIIQLEEEQLRNEVRIELIKDYYNQGIGHSSDQMNDSTVFALKKANQLIEVVQNTDNTPFQDSIVKVLQFNIKRPSFRVFLKNTYLDNEEITLKVDYRNLSELEFYIFNPRKDDLKDIHGNKSEIISWIEKNEVIKRHSIILPKNENFNSLTAEFPLFKLPFGNYILLVKDKKELKESNFYLAEFDISNLAVLTQNQPKKGVQFFVTNRGNGKAIKDAKITVKENRRNDAQATKGQNFTATTNLKGIAYFHNLRKNKSYTYSVSFGEDKLDFKEKHFYYRAPIEREARHQTYFFTDRSIYKAGQKVYFKGIKTIESSNNSVLGLNEKSDVFLIDPNGKHLDTLNLISSDYGSINGSFNLPQQSLNGNYRIATKGGQCYFQLTDYKRPSYKIVLNDSLVYTDNTTTAYGRALAFSGEAERNVKIVFKVFLTNHSPRPYYNSFYYPFPAERVLYASGETTTDQNGKYKLEFPLKSPKKKSYPTYEVEIIASNQRGESIEKSFKLNSKNIDNISLSISESISKDGAIDWDELENMVVTSTNRNGNKVDKKLLLKLWKLEVKKDVSLNRIWSPADYYMTNNSFNERKGDRSEKYKKNQLLSESSIDCNKTLNLFNKLDEGVYQIELEDPHDSLFYIKKNFYLYDAEKMAFGKSDFFWISELNTDLTTQDEVQLLIGSSQNSASIYYDIDYKGDILESGVIELSNSKKIFRYKPNMDLDRQFQIHFYIIHSNHFKKKTVNVITPKESELEFKLLSFRDKTKPSQKESYSFRILKDGKAVEAEVMAAMYDASLDQFVNHEWNFDPQRKYFPAVSRNADNSFQQSYPIAFTNKAFIQKPIPYRSYEQLNWFGFSIHSGYHPFLATMDGAVVESKSNQTFKLTDIDDDNKGDVEPIPEQERKIVNPFPLRADFRETAFFYPELKTNSKGEVQFEFEVPESLTEWKLMVLAHSKSLDYNYLEKKVISQKELMVKVNAPKFLRSEDKAIIKADLINLSDQDLVLESYFSIFDSNKKLIGENKKSTMVVPANGNKTIQLKLIVPKGIPYIEYEIVANSNTHQDGEKNSIAVIPREEIVTKSFPFSVSENDTKALVFKEFQNDLKNSMNDIIPLNYTIEYSSTQWDRILETLHHIILQKSRNPSQFAEKLAAIELFDLALTKNDGLRSSLLKKYAKWKPSPLESNPELKSILINETPWALVASKATIQNQELIKLLTPSYLDSIKSVTESNLIELQFKDGAWPWYKGMKRSRFISESIVFLFSQLAEFNKISFSPELKKSINKTISYLDKELQTDYQNLLKDNANLSKVKISESQLSYLFARSYFNTEIEDEFLSFYFIKALEDWQMLEIAEKAKLGQFLLNIGIENETVLQIYASIKEFIIEDVTKGAYWKAKVNSGYYIANESISQHSIASRFLNRVSTEDPILEELNKWLFFQKKNTLWGSTNSSTILAVCKLIERTNPIESASTYSRITIGNRMDTTLYKNQSLKVSWANEEIFEDLAYLNISSNKKEISFGSIYWQSLQDKNAVASQNNQLQIERSLYKEVSKDGIIKLISIDSSDLRIGDKLIARLKITANSKQSFVHLSVANSAASMPINTLSGFNYEDNISFYKEIELSKINFFFNQIEKGVYIIEIPYLLNQSGEYESGHCSIQSQYSPDNISTTPSKLLIIKGN